MIDENILLKLLREIQKLLPLIYQKYSMFQNEQERDLKKLTDEKVIEYTGSAKDGYGRVKK